MSSYLAQGNVQYNYAQLEGIWVQAGGQPGAAPIAAAIAMAESGGNTTATNQDSNGTVDRGLWQVNSVHGAQSTYDVMGNARAAVAISNNGQNWAPWTTYNTGAYRQFLQVGVPADTSAPINGTNAAANASLALDIPGTSIGIPGTNGIPSILNPLNWFGNVAGGASQTLIKFFMQGLIVTILNPMLQIAAGVAGITAGGAMVVVGFMIIARNTETGQAVERGAGKAAQAGVMLAAPEATAATRYVGAEGQATTVAQTRRPARAVNVGGQRVQLRPAQVRTQVTKTTPQVLNAEAKGYVNKPGGPEQNGTK